LLNNAFQEVLVPPHYSPSREFILFSYNGERWEQKVIAQERFPADIWVVDINGDGKKDIVIASHGSPSLTGKDRLGTLAWVECQQQCKTHRIDAIRELHYLGIMDVDLDGDKDIIAAANAGKFLLGGPMMGKDILATEMLLKKKPILANSLLRILIVMGGKIFLGPTKWGNPNHIFQLGGKKNLFLKVTGNTIEITRLT
jgi:hypothetical protein